MKKILLITLLCFSSVKTKYNIPKFLAEAGCIGVAGTLVILAYHEWPSAKESTTKSKVLAGLTGCYAILPLVALGYIHKMT